MLPVGQRTVPLKWIKILAQHQAIVLDQHFSPIFHYQRTTFPNGSIRPGENLLRVYTYIYKMKSNALVFVTYLHAFLKQTSAPDTEWWKIHHFLFRKHDSPILKGKEQTTCAVSVSALKAAALKDGQRMAFPWWGQSALSCSADLLSTIHIHWCTPARWGSCWHRDGRYWPRGGTPEVELSTVVLCHAAGHLIDIHPYSYIPINHTWTQIYTISFIHIATYTNVGMR